MYSKLFLEKPVPFASRFALIPERSSQNPSQLKAKQVNPNLTVYQVAGGNRILYANIEKDLEAEGGCEVKLSEAPLTKDWFPVYWLPWEVMHTYRITLKPPKSVVNPPDPHVFFTASVSGCMVHVDGDPTQPTVYHSNARDLQVGQPQNANTPPTRWSTQAKILEMEDRFRAARQLHSKTQHHQLTKVRSVDATRYSPLSTEEPQERDQVRLAWESDYKADPNMLQMNPMGTIFGIKDAHSGIWTFYYQSLILLIYRKNHVKFREWIVQACKPI